MLPAALGAFVAPRHRIPAIMAHKPVIRRMVGKRNAAIWAAHNIPALGAGNICIMPAPVQKKYSLLFFFEHAGQLFVKSAAYKR